MDIKFKKLVPNAVIPTKAHPTDAGADLTATSYEQDEYGNAVYGTGLSMEIPEGYVGLIFPRSSNSKMNLSLTNCVGVIDSHYRGEIMVKFRCTMVSLIYRKLWRRIKTLLTGTHPWNGFNILYHHFHDMEYHIGDRIAQLIIMPYPEVNYIEADELSTTDRGTGGYGSTGK